jgi:hypothetical protein
MPRFALAPPQVGRQQRLGPQPAQVVEEGAQLAVGIVIVNPLRAVFIGHGLEQLEGALGVVARDTGADLREQGASADRMLEAAS